MSGYAVTIFTAALAASFCACMSYGGKMKGATAAALCVLVLSVVISPLSLIGENKIFMLIFSRSFQKAAPQGVTYHSLLLLFCSR